MVGKRRIEGQKQKKRIESDGIAILCWGQYPNEALEQALQVPEERKSKGREQKVQSSK